MKGLYIFLVFTISNCWIQIVLPKPMEHGRLNQSYATRKLYEAARGISVLIAPASRQGSDEPVFQRRHARAFASRMHKVCTRMKNQAGFQTSIPPGYASISA